MMMDLILAGMLVLILGAAGAYVYRAKKSGKKCIGCPDGCSCGSHGASGCCGGCCGDSHS